MKHNLPLTYDQKILGVVDGTVRQTIRTGRRYMVGDMVSFHGWEGAPYRSKWSFRTPYFELSEVIPIVLYPDGIEIDGEITPWAQLDDLARLDGIEPETRDRWHPYCRACRDLPDDVRGHVLSAAMMSLHKEQMCGVPVQGGSA